MEKTNVKQIAKYASNWVLANLILLVIGHRKLFLENLLWWVGRVRFNAPDLNQFTFKGDTAKGETRSMEWNFPT